MSYERDCWCGVDTLDVESTSFHYTASNIQNVRFQVAHEKSFDTMKIGGLDLQYKANPTSPALSYPNLRTGPRIYDST